MSLPERTTNRGSAPRRPIWSLFENDPRQNTNLRAGSRDRDAAQQALTEAYVDGQLTEAEHNDRAGRAMAVVHLGEFVPLLDDLTLPATSTSGAPTPNPEQAPMNDPEPVDQPYSEADRRTTLWGALGAFVMVSLITNVVWFATGADGYYWPMWAMLGTFLPVIVVLFGGQEFKAARRRDRQHRRLGR